MNTSPHIVHIRETTHIINIQMSKLSIFYNILCAQASSTHRSTGINAFISTVHKKFASQIDLKVISHQCISPEYENAVCHFLYGFSCTHIRIFWLDFSVVVGWYFIWVSHVSLMKYSACPFLFRLFHKMQQICIYLSSCVCLCVCR